MTVQCKERRERGLWLHRHDPPVFNDHLLEEQPRERVPLRLVGRRPHGGQVGEQCRRPLEGRPEVAFHLQGTQLPLQPLPALQILRLGDVPQLEEGAGIGELRLQALATLRRLVRHGARPGLRGQELLAVVLGDGEGGEVRGDLLLVDAEEGGALRALRGLPPAVAVDAGPALLPVDVQRAAAVAAAQEAGEGVDPRPAAHRQRVRGPLAAPLLGGVEEGVVGDRLVRPADPAAVPVGQLAQVEPILQQGAHRVLREGAIPPAAVGAVAPVVEQDRLCWPVTPSVTFF